eukprot:CAMPEP_0184544970 /NCGR_PEP_ID=MMETSP0199_2-20130426/3979_1 /TAXON_ID=1112570 /ORGANISM="Thraustochytrium sp., Strain LLF1b" /LENGTH=340 /DNA_ID=CAMNT_0026939207 /DNA_START=107 /DNA_END=1129 /DNA_ORIENTATION=+
MADRPGLSVQTRSQRRTSLHFAASQNATLASGTGRKRKLQSIKQEVTVESISVKAEQGGSQDVDISAVEIKAERLASPQRAKKPKASSKTVTKPRKEPSKWRELLKLLVELRQERNAPVDSMGAEMLGEKGPNFEFQTLIALMLSSQTKDQVVAETMRKLKEHTLSVESIAKMKDEKLHELISKVGFHNNKTKYIKQSVQILQEKYGGKVPDTLEGLVELPGVGPKMALLVLLVAFDKKDAGIAIDTHVHRICNQLGWVSSKTPEQTRVQLESWLPKKEWHQINLVMVGVGQMIQQPEYRTKMLAMIDTWPDQRQKEALALLKRLGLKIPRKTECKAKNA